MRILLSILLIGGLMSFQLIGAGSDLASTQTQINKNILELKNNETTTIFKDDTGTRRVLLGKGADGFYGVKVSETGVDVYSADDTELVFNSNNRNFKILEQGFDNLSVDFSSHGASSSGTDQTTLNIDYSTTYSFVPLVVLYLDLGDGLYRPLSDGSIWFTTFTSASWKTAYFQVQATSSGINVTLRQDWGTGVGGSISAYVTDAFNFKWYAMQESAN